MTTCSSAAYGTRHRRGGAAPDGAPSSAIRIRAVVPAPRSHVAKCLIFVARGPDGLLPCTTNSSLTRRQHPRAHSRTHPLHARTRRHCGRIVVAFSLLHAHIPALPPPPLDLAARPATFFFFFFFFRVPTPFLTGRSFFLLLRVASAAPSFCLLSRCAARHACPQAKTRSLARTPTMDGRTTRRAVPRRNNTVVTVVRQTAGDSRG